jgi:type IX secretion system PorP/SprF family membrane protein
MKYNFFFILLFFLSAFFTGNAQDIHLSQFYSSPLYLNPANTGYFPCDLRLGGNYRSQWGSFIPYKTQSVWGDGKISKRFFRGDWIGVGGLIYGDQAAKVLKNTKFMALAAYHKNLVRNGMFSAHLGASLGLVNRSVSTGDFVFDNQWNGTSFSSAVSSGENIVDNSIYYFDLNTGAIIGFKKRSLNAFLGASFNHLNKPNITFYNNKQRMSMRNVVHGGMSFTRGSLLIKPQCMVSFQAGAREVLFGSHFIYNYNGLIDLYFGLWDRLSGDLIPSLGFDWKGWLLLFSYDVNYSKLSSATGMKGGWEIALIKTFGCSGNGAGLGDEDGTGSTGPKRKKAAACPAYN